MSSIFEEIDQQANSGTSFWTPLEAYVLQDIIENKLHISSLNILKSRDQWKKRSMILTTTCIYYCKKNTETPKQMSIIKWKKVDPFTEDNETEERYGFRLGQGTVFQEFYTETVEQLEEWLDKLGRVSILNEIEDDYAVIKEIGRGNYAKVYLAQDLLTHQQFAVKTIDKEEMRHKSRGLSAVISEIEIMRKLKHPNLVTLHRIYENNNFINLVLDFVDSGTLFNRIEKKERLPEVIAAKFMVNMMEVLKYMHSINIVHRDLKPENILMTSIEDDSQFKICDFGLACIAGDDQNLRCGSPGYVAPEILMSKSYNNKVDIFSAGIILYIILSGRAPFYGKTSNEILIMNKECKLHFHDRFWGHISRDGIDFVLRLTDPDPNSRYSAEQTLRHPWLNIAHCEPNMSLLAPVPINNVEGSPTEGGVASFTLMRRINDRREIGAEIVFGNVAPYSNNPENMPESRNATGLLQRLREKDSNLK